jgi:type IV secretion system protein VirB9
VQFPYNVGSQPVVAAGVFELTVISLEPGEQVNNVSSGDPLRWSYSLAYSGSGDVRQAHVMVKPTKPGMSTDFFITTDKRAYLLKMVSGTDGKYVRDVRFWYPDTIQSNLMRMNSEKQAQNGQETVVAELPNLDVS